MAEPRHGGYGSVDVSELPPQVRERRHTGNLETVPLLQDDPISMDHSINASTSDDPAPAIRTQPRGRSWQDRQRELLLQEKDLARIKDEENCPGHLMTYINVWAEKYKRTKTRYKHYGLLVFVLNIWCTMCCGFPFAAPFMLFAAMASRSVRNLNEQNDFVSSRTCRCFLITNIVLTIIAGLTFQLGVIAAFVLIIVAVASG